jgi:hypothetical protein
MSAAAIGAVIGSAGGQHGRRQSARVTLLCSRLTLYSARCL